METDCPPGGTGHCNNECPLWKNNVCCAGLTQIEQAIFDIIKEPLTLGREDDLGVISDSDALAKAQKIAAARDAAKGR